jgi:hypothetical protein
MARFAVFVPLASLFFRASPTEALTAQISPRLFKVVSFRELPEGSTSR